MVDTRQVVKIFLASPGDLAEERVAAKTRVDEFNRIWADYFGCQVELVGWEDTVSAFGRPQEIINRDLEQCGYFIGILWKRWGTPPDKSGPFTSGFQEEFETSVERRLCHGSPEISLFFKNIDPDMIRDPGDDLKKVLAFRKQIMDEKTVLFESFTDIKDFEQKFNRCVAEYIKRLKSEEKIRAEDDESPNPSKDNETVRESQTPSAKPSPLSGAGAAFLRNFISTGERDAERISTVDVARFRLLGTLVKAQGNDTQTLGVHDANILFAHRSDLELSEHEYTGLVECGLRHFQSENTPLWSWLAAINAFSENWLPFRSLYGETTQRVTALRIMQIAQVPLESKLDIARETYIEMWLSESRPSAVKEAALKYLSDYGKTDDLPAIKTEVEAGNYQTTNIAIDSMLRINLRDSRKKAIFALSELQPDSINPSLMEALFKNDDSIETESLLQVVLHRNSNVRRTVTRLLRERRALDVQLADKLISDSDAGVRFEAMRSLIDWGRTFSFEDARKVLVKPKASFSSGLIGRAIGSRDSEGEAYLNQFREHQLAAMSLSDLEKTAHQSILFDIPAEFILYERQFSAKATKLRAAVDDQFKTEFSKKLDALIEKYGSESNIVEKTKQLEETLRKELTRKGLDVICRKGGAQDLPRVRRVLSSDFLNDSYSETEIEYLRKFGEWEDIPLIIATLNPTADIGLLSLGSSPTIGRLRTAARAIFQLAQGRFADLLIFSAPSRLLSILIIESSEKLFRTLNDTSIHQLFRSEHDAVRKATALKCVLVLPKNRLIKLLNDYLRGGKNQYYYNVIHWLDLGISISRDRARSIAKTALQTVAEK